MNTTVVACCQLTPVLTADAITYAGSATPSARPSAPPTTSTPTVRPELYRRIAEQAIPQRTTPQQTTTQMPLPS